MGVHIQNSPFNITVLAQEVGDSKKVQVSGNDCKPPGRIVIALKSCHHLTGPSNMTFNIMRSYFFTVLVLVTHIPDDTEH